jgi:hypothetical protein
MTRDRKELVVKFFIFPTPIRLHTFNFHVEETLNMRLKLHKYAWGLKVIMHEISPRKFAKFIYEANIIFVTCNRNRSGPQTSEKIS